MNLRLRLLTFAIAASAVGVVGTGAAEHPPTGFTDTPRLPNQKWRVHDAERPQPSRVTPGKEFSHQADAPSDAVVLFDGSDLSGWSGGKGQARWKVENGYMEVNKTGTIRTKEEFGDFQLHLEFATPEEVVDNGQGRGNSGVIVYGKYEIQVLDSYDNVTYADGHVGALYGQFPPRVIAARPPGEWQTYDVIFESARWNDAGELVKPANATVILNGVLLHHKQEFIGAVAHRAVGKYSPHPPKGPIVLQDHGNPVRYRNIWIRRLNESD